MSQLFPFNILKCVIEVRFYAYFIHNMTLYFDILCLTPLRRYRKLNSGQIWILEGKQILALRASNQH